MYLTSNGKFKFGSCGAQIDDLLLYLARTGKMFDFDDEQSPVDKSD
jgi:hypothetical protein